MKYLITVKNKDSEVLRTRVTKEIECFLVDAMIGNNYSDYTARAMKLNHDLIDNGYVSFTHKANGFIVEINSIKGE